MCEGLRGALPQYVKDPSLRHVAYKQRFAAFVRDGFQSRIAVSSQNRIETVGVSQLPHQRNLHQEFELIHKMSNVSKLNVARRAMNTASPANPCRRPATHRTTRAIAALEGDARQLFDGEQRAAVVHAAVARRDDAAGSRTFCDGNAPFVHEEGVTECYSLAWRKRRAAHIMP